jgi:hypothetical protein
MNFDAMLRAITIACRAGGTLFWLYTFYYIAQAPEGDGARFQWLAEVPLTAIFLRIILMISSVVIWTVALPRMRAKGRGCATAIRPA